MTKNKSVCVAKKLDGSRCGALIGKNFLSTGFCGKHQIQKHVNNTTKFTAVTWGDKTCLQRNKIDEARLQVEQLDDLMEEAQTPHSLQTSISEKNVLLLKAHESLGDEYRSLYRSVEQKIVSTLKDANVPSFEIEEEKEIILKSMFPNSSFSLSTPKPYPKSFKFDFYESYVDDAVAATITKEAQPDCETYFELLESYENINQELSMLLDEQYSYTKEYNELAEQHRIAKSVMLQEEKALDLMHAKAASNIPPSNVDVSIHSSSDVVDVFIGKDGKYNVWMLKAEGENIRYIQVDRIEDDVMYAEDFPVLVQEFKSRNYSAKTALDLVVVPEGKRYKGNLKTYVLIDSRD